MKVIHLETGRHLYGGARQVLYLLRGLSERGIENLLVCPDGSAIAERAKEFTEVYEVKMRGDLDITFIGRFYHILKKYRPDIVHLHSRRGADILGGIGARLYNRNAKVILTRRVDNPEVAYLARIKYSLYDRIITISEAIKRVLLEEGVPGERITIVRSAVDTGELHLKCDWQWFRDEFALEDGDYPIGMVAQFIRRKGHRYLIEATRGIVEAHPGVRFLLFGKGPLEDEVKRQIQELGLSYYFRLCGFRDDIKRLYPCLRLLVHPAEMEGLGVSLIEASGSGVPIVAFRAGGVPEIVRDGENGFVVEPGDTEALKGAILRLIEDEALRIRMSLKGVEIVRKEFSLDAMVEGNLQVYREVLR